MLKIVEFSKPSQLTVKALRFYEREGLLAPSEVNPRTGHRLYATSLLTDAAHFVACAMVASNLPRDASARFRVHFRLRDD